MKTGKKKSTLAWNEIKVENSGPRQYKKLSGSDLRTKHEVSRSESKTNRNSPQLSTVFCQYFPSPTSQRPQAKTQMIKDRKPTNHRKVDFHRFPKRLAYQAKFFTEPTIV
ncbi:hypothetical protein BHYA_0043g00310 [Botrytis hyacinthi]|uniref:Uncharacterized protein n=1 Tax=Botrytis hyacinthi TaxID=278943 RepID=A0A4Z1GT26_9HELO|nr:hypothetical protein BHYA_0043g00310 [Botrytis hyacinthi]